MIFSENRYPLFGIMLWKVRAAPDHEKICGKLEKRCFAREPEKAQPASIVGWTEIEDVQSLVLRPWLLNTLPNPPRLAIYPPGIDPVRSTHLH
jgi:hypothetical protein